MSLRGHDRMVVGYTTTREFSAYHRKRCEFESSSWRAVFNRTLSDKVCQWHGTGRWFFPLLWFPPPEKLTSKIMLKSCCGPRYSKSLSIKGSLFFFSFTAYCKYNMQFNLYIMEHGSLESQFKVPLNRIYMQGCIFKTRTKSKTNTTLYKREGLCQPGLWLFIATENIWIFGWGYKCCYPFLKYTEGVLNLHQAWHSQNTLPTMVHGEGICTINWFASPSLTSQSNRVAFHQDATWGRFILI